MSGIVGIVHFDEAPVDRHLLGQMTAFLAFRGPDAQEIWVDSNVGFGCALLKTTDESERERQPFTLDGRVWIVADARVDARHELAQELKAHRHQNLSPDATGVEMILRAYQTWGENCVGHLLGDFAFAIWDRPKQRLFCARDHLGVKPFFYAHLGEKVIFGNTLDCIRQHPAVSDRLNDLAIADFLLFDFNQDLATTSFADIQRLPPAHCASWSSGGAGQRRYWTLPIDEPLYFRKTDDYVDRFRELLDQAVDDRLRTPKVGVLMSGGLDSPTLAATASKLLRRRSPAGEIRAFTTVLDGVLDGDERRYAGLVAGHLKIPIHFADRSARPIDPEWEKTTVRTREPSPCPTNLVLDREEYQVMSRYSRVWFYGEGPDNALKYEWEPYLAYLLRRRDFGRLAKNLCEMAVQLRRIPFLPRIVRSLKTRWQQEPEGDYFPQWLERDFAARLKLRERWEERQRDSAAPCPHPWHPRAYRSLCGPGWEYLFSESDAEAIGALAEIRHPFVDLRLLRFMLSLPVVPWCRSKYLIRQAMRGALPEAVLRRAKSPLTGDPQWEGAQRFGIAPLVPAAGLEKYVDFIRVPDRVGHDMMLFWVDLRLRALNYWFRNLNIQGPPAAETTMPRVECTEKLDRRPGSEMEIVKAT